MSGDGKETASVQNEVGESGVEKTEIPQKSEDVLDNSAWLVPGVCHWLDGLGACNGSPTYDQIYRAFKERLMADMHEHSQHEESAARANEFRELMAKLGWSQRKTGDELGVDQRTVRYWVAANPAPPIVAIYALRYVASLSAIRGEK